MHPALFCAVSSHTPSPSLGRRFFFPNTLPQRLPLPAAASIDPAKCVRLACHRGARSGRSNVYCLSRAECGAIVHVQMSCPCAVVMRCAMCCGVVLTVGGCSPRYVSLPSPFLSAPLRWPGASLFLSHCPTDSVCVCHPCSRGFV